jgi:hypothetical protein
VRWVGWGCVQSEKDGSVSRMGGCPRARRKIPKVLARWEGGKEPEYGVAYLPTYLQCPLGISFGLLRTSYLPTFLGWIWRACPASPGFEESGVGGQKGCLCSACGVDV